ncbi:MAG: hypothetical protein IKT73_00995, partial [Anaerotignum sp.]|nr:hypothetical protein [Anaerotignum sp.]
MNKGILQLKKWMCLLLMTVFFVMPAVAYAGAEKGSLQVVLKGSGHQVYLYPVAAADGTLTTDFSGAEISAGDMLTEKYGRKIAKTLSVYAKQNNISGVGRTTDSNGAVHYTNLEKGVYLVVSAGNNGAEMQPFLVRIPTVINGTESYYLKATPKAVVPGGSSSGGPEKEEPEEKPNEKPEENPEEKPEENPEENPTEEPGTIPQDPEAPSEPGNTGTPAKPIEPIEDEDIPHHRLEMDDAVIPQTGAVRYPIW